MMAITAAAATPIQYRLCGGRGTAGWSGNVDDVSGRASPPGGVEVSDCCLDPLTSGSVGSFQMSVRAMGCSILGSDGADGIDAAADKLGSPTRSKTRPSAALRNRTGVAHS